MSWTPHPEQALDSFGESPAAALYRCHARSLLTYIRSRITSPEDAEDLLVEVFLVGIQHETLLRLSEREQLTWLRHVARNRIIDRYRRQGHRPSVVRLETIAETLCDDEAQEPEVQTLRGGDHAQLRVYLSSLPALHQEIIWLRFAENLSTKAIAQRLGRSDGGIRMLLSRILNHLRTMYEQEKGENDVHGTSRSSVPTRECQ